MVFTSSIYHSSLQQAQLAYDAEVDKHTTEDGVWHDMKQCYIYGQKPDTKQ